MDYNLFLRHLRGPTLTRIIIFLSIMGPGIITASVDNDAGGITTYSLAGSQFGYVLLWTFIPITIALAIIQEMGVPNGSRVRQRPCQSHSGTGRRAYYFFVDVCAVVDEFWEYPC